MTDHVLYHDDRVIRGVCQPLDQAVETAQEWLEERGRDHVDIDEVRPASHSDVSDGYAAGLLSTLSEWLAEDEELSCDDGAPVLAIALESQEYDAFRHALSAYIAAHVDLSGAAWQPTGRMLRVYADGTHEIVPRRTP